MGGSRRLRSVRSLVVLLLVFSGGLGLAACGSDEEEAQSFESAEGKFRVDFPGTPERTEQTEPTAGQALKIVLFTVANGDKAYSVAYSDLPPEVTQVAPSTVLQGVPEGSAARVPGRVTSKTASTFVNSPAIDYEIEGEGRSNGAKVRAKAVLVGRRLYILQAAGKDAETPFYDTMLSSFQLIP